MHSMAWILGKTKRVEELLVFPLIYLTKPKIMANSSMKSGDGKKKAEKMVRKSVPVVK